jgi:para-nitrobenzyl esterase
MTWPAPLLALALVHLGEASVTGVRSGATERFLGLPYAAAQRWSAPAPAASWRGLRDGAVPAPRCPQTAAGLAAGRESEDCLTLDIVRPAAASAQPRAVYVYVHGGGAAAGGASDHDGAALAERGGVIVVTVNYRLGALGFMNSAAIAAQAPHGQAGNYAIDDVRMALEWVRENIGRFGGDPQRVTIGGESAGGTVICPLLAWPRAAGLFRAAIISSDDCLHDVDTLAQSRERAAALAQRLDCRDAACLRAAPAAALLAAGGFAAPAIGAGGPLPDYPAALIASGRWTPVPLLIGANLHEGRDAARGFLQYDERRYAAWLGALLAPPAQAAVQAAYAGEHAGEPFEFAYKAGAVMTDSGMRGLGGCSSLRLARAAARTAPVWFYQFEDPAPPFSRRGGFDFGAAHAAELPYLWPGGAFAAQAARLDGRQRELAALMQDYWAAFIRDGRPEGRGLPAWPALDGGYLALLPGASGAAPLAAYEAQHRCALWDRLPVIMQRGDPLP